MNGRALGLRLGLVMVMAAKLAAAAPAPASAEDEVRQTLAARFDGDRSGACVLAAVIDGGETRRARFCALPRNDGGPGFEQAFEIGSVSKTMTAFLVGRLIDAGRWSLDDPIARHLPEGTVLPRQGERQILLRDLLTHSSGLPALPARLHPKNPADPYADLSEADLLASLGEVKLERPIGSQASYSNFGMMVVSLAVARSLGGDFEAALRRELFEPLRMDGAFIARRPAGEASATGHLPDGSATSAWHVTPNLAGVGMVQARLDDMERYARAQLGLAGTPPAVAATMRRTQQPLAAGFGMNWMLATVQGHALAMHEGGTGGFSSLVALEPAAQRAVVLLADTGLADLGGLGDLGLKLLGVPTRLQAPRLTQPVPAALLAALPGDYALGSLPMRIWAEQGRLHAQAGGQQAFELFYDSQGQLYAKGFSALLIPIQENGRIERFAWRQGGGLVEGLRKNTAPAAPAGAASGSGSSAGNPRWQQWVGDYPLTPQFSLRVFEEAGRLKIRGTAQPAIEAEVTGEDRIEVKAVGAVLEFRRDAQGQVVSVLLHQGGRNLAGPRR
ncbi:MAG: serine hydrolase domain-containing protein [Burkholderiaceae bacterium]